ncbi:MAG: hypothetical protein KIT84_43500 [Labilithrix sp.]|nr:hypothetical protein [Labilithrix sp.]MCW5817945.1 hypothetical protein [Labilithrix sp.]
MTLPAAFSLTSASVGLLAALLALGMSSAPGWRELRWFALCATFAAFFNLANIPTTLPWVAEPTLLFTARLSLFFGGLHTVTWFVFIAARERRALSRLERAAIGVGITFSVLTLVPGVILEEDLNARHVPLVAATYRDATPTLLGEIAIVDYVASVMFLLGRALRDWRRGDSDGGTHALALSFVLVGAVHDGLATGNIIRSPYILDFSLVAFVLVVGASITSRFVASARALERSKRKLEVAQAQLVAKERLAALGELSAVVAHEVRNPLAVVFNALARLRRVQTTDEEHAALLRILQEEAERLRDIVSDLLEFASPRPPVLAPASLDEIVRGAALAARNVVGSAESDVVVEVGPSTELECDERLVRQAVLNLVTNALQASGRAGPVRVTIRGAADDPAITVRVADDGDGVPDDLRERVFTPFFSTRPKGTGLGLAVVRRCAEAHGGKVSLHPNRPRGASFELELPRRSRPSVTT